MTAQPDEPDLESEFEELVSQKPAKPSAVPLVRTKKQKDAAIGAAAAEEARAAQTAAQAVAMETAQMANLLIAGHSIESIAASIGATPAEVEQRLTANSARYVRTQPALRQWARQFIAGKYMGLLDSVYEQATNKHNPNQLAFQDRARPLLAQMAKLYGAEAPTQTEVKVDATPESVQMIVDKIAATQGLGYNVDIFSGDDDDEDIVDAEEVHTATQESLLAIEQAARDSDSAQPEDEENPL